jgi:hypothetical protein
MPDETKRYSVDELRAMRARGESRSDWARVDAMTEAEIEAAIAADPDSDGTPAGCQENTPDPQKSPPG